MKINYLSLTVLLIVSSLPAQTLDELVDSTLVFAEQQLSGTITEIGPTNNAVYPRWVDPNSDWKWRVESNIGKWTNGFFPGCLWYLYQSTNDSQWENYARAWTANLKDVQDITSIYTDQGFIIVPTLGNGFQLTNDSTYLPIIARSAESYAGRWNAEAKVIDSWDKGAWLNNPYVISGAIDQLMNVAILFEAALITGDTTYSSIATAYAEKVMENNVRDDYSTYQVVRYNARTGEVLNKGTIQGYADSSTWSRGQAWAIYGFTMCYRYTHDQRFLTTAKGLANYFIDHLPEDHMPYWDFKAPNIPNEPKDASAAAIVSSALFELISFIVDDSEIIKFRDAAYGILASLASEKYLTDPQVTNAILLHSTANKPKNKRVDVPLIYADYYFIEALLRYQEYRNISSVVSEAKSEVSIPGDFVLLQNFPNPFNPGTTISYRLSMTGPVELIVYNILGQKVCTLVAETQKPGTYKVTFYGDDLPSGVYYYQLRSGENIQTKKMILMR